MSHQDERYDIVCNSEKLNYCTTEYIYDLFSLRNGLMTFLEKDGVDSKVCTINFSLYLNRGNV